MPIIDGMQFMATEFVEGRTLRQLIAPDGMKVSEALDISIQAASALMEAHAAGIIHRDIKQENMMVRRILLFSPRFSRT